jgi:glutamate-ammonia-ligase adenylyltransferase
MDLLLQRKDTREIIVSIFSRSTHLARLLLAAENLEGIFEYPDIRMDCRSIQERLTNFLFHAEEPLDAVREFKVIEELKAGMLFLKGPLDAYTFSRTLTMVADTIIRALLGFLRCEKGFAVVGLGGFGGRDLNIGSDLDLLFLNAPEVPARAGKRATAEELIRLLSEYTSKGVAYKIDMRLRPDGSKGVLANNVDGYEHYYLKSAHPWEIQSLLRARPIAGDLQLLRAFQKMRRKVILARGVEITGSGMRAMRKRIINEVSKESTGYDVKNGPGGIKEIEFLTQYLQLKHVRNFPDLTVSSTVAAIKRLANYGILDRVSEELFLTSHGFLKSVDTLLRLNEEDSVRIGSEVLDVMTTFLNLGSKDELIKKILDTRQNVIRTTERLY